MLCVLASSSLWVENITSFASVSQPKKGIECISTRFLRLYPSDVLSLILLVTVLKNTKQQMMTKLLILCSAINVLVIHLCFKHFHIYMNI